MILSPLTRLITNQTEGPRPAFSDIMTRSLECCHGTFEVVTTQAVHDKLCNIGVIPHYPTQPNHERLQNNRIDILLSYLFVP